MAATQQRGLGSLGRADLLLLSLPVVFVGLCTAGLLLFESWPPAVGAAGAVCCVVIGDGLFVHPPTDEC